ncbi:Gfo/Idh/MocA family oxidoreductase [Bacillus sp. sid0103]|uniref:Gfo/Idh/MocA family protein n=1 Tax=Bacillus sp. sid0103 TaxID=2856337 RepID=UPI001C47C4B4|nr:Gfo/Idh/MocA family oxidoreductase [Bacillus sp. sid0103]MBV7507580.1 Gfo/Idh/MocA family oxidoreductase [Bacillus sp. sid0103]
MINVALLSKWHVHAEDYARQAENSKELSIKLVWDENRERGQKWAEELGVPFERDLEAVLSNPDIDAVIVSTPTNLHTEVILAAAKHKKHIFTEKVLAFSSKEVSEIFAAVEEANVQLMVSLPRLTESYYLYAQEVVDKGLLGKLTTVRCRLAHNGAVSTDEHPKGWLPGHFFNREQCGGGALIDLGAHPIYLTNRLAGDVEAVTARLQNTQSDEVDDNAVVIVEYKSGALGIIETGFLSAGSPFQLELYGTEGALLIEDDQIRVKSVHQDKKSWMEPKELPASLPMPMEQWIRAIEDGAVPAITNQDVFQLTLINQAAALSTKEGRRIELTEIK